MLAVGFRRRLQTGPALRIAPVPLATLALSTLFHAALIVAAMIAVNAIKESQPKVYTINLVPAVPAIGRPEASATAPTPEPPTPRREPPAPPAPRPELPARPSAPPELPARERPREAAGLPERTLPPRSAAPAPPRPEQKELPSVASAPPPPRIATPATTTPIAPPRDLPSAPSAPVGLPTGSAQGKGKLTVDTNFPYAWYVKILHDKITERWDPYALPGQQPLITFEIGRNGTVDPGKIRVAQSSGNRNYDRVAVRAIAEAGPFPPLPDEFKDQLVTVNIQFRFEAGRT